jgi:hypothetical protein
MYPDLFTEVLINLRSYYRILIPIATIRPLTLKYAPKVTEPDTQGYKHGYLVFSELPLGVVENSGRGGGVDQNELFKSAAHSRI